MDTIQNFVHLYDEHWFILVHVAIEALGANILIAIAEIQRALATQELEVINRSLALIANALWQQIAILKRIPEKMSAKLYYKTFRPYIQTS